MPAIGVRVCGGASENRFTFAALRFTKKTNAFDERRVMTEPLPDRLCADPDSPYYDEKLLARGVGIRFNGAEKTNVQEYCISEGWVRVVAGKSVDRRGNPMTVKLKGQVEPYLEEPPTA